jgi:hypothetical protein
LKRQISANLTRKLLNFLNICQPRKYKATTNSDKYNNQVIFSHSLGAGAEKKALGNHLDISYHFSASSLLEPNSKFRLPSESSDKKSVST